LKESIASIFRVEKSASEEPASAGGCNSKGILVKFDIGLRPNVGRNSFSTPAGSMNLRPYMKLKSVSFFKNGLS
jgi:hypothetical protein